MSGGLTELHGVTMSMKEQAGQREEGVGVLLNVQLKAGTVQGTRPHGCTVKKESISTMAV